MVNVIEDLLISLGVLFLGCFLRLLCTLKPLATRIDNLLVEEPRVSTREDDPLVEPEPGSRWRTLAKKEHVKKKTLLAKKKTTDDRSAKRSIEIEIEKCDSQIKVHNEKAASEIFRHHNDKFGDSLEGCDLHWLDVEEAEMYLSRHLSKCREKEVLITRVITGRGKHTPGGVAKLHPKMKAFLHGITDVQVVKENVGDFLVLVV